VWASFLTRWRAGNAVRSECQGVFQMIVRWSMVDDRWQPFPRPRPHPLPLAEYRCINALCITEYFLYSTLKLTMTLTTGAAAAFGAFAALVATEPLNTPYTDRKMY